MTSVDPVDANQVLIERRLRTLRELTARVAIADSAEGACRLAASVLGDNPADTPFTLFYLLDGRTPRLAATSGVEPRNGAAPALPLAEVVQMSQPKFVDPLEVSGLPARAAFIIPIGLRGQPSPLALMVAGVGPGTQTDGRFVSFLEFVAAQIAGAITSARSIEKANRKLQEAGALRDEFLTVASHELRTPLTALGFQADSLLHALRQAGPHDETSERCLARAEKLRTQATRLEQLIEVMFDVFSLGRDSVTPAREELDLAEVARPIVERLRLEAKQTISLNAEPSRGAWDRQHLEQILTQLIANALKFGGGQPVDVRIDGTPEAARIFVKDRGIGVAAEMQEHIFERYVRMAPTSQFGGLGLGLWMVRVLAQAMSGSVRVESQAGEGAEFIVELPRHP